MYKLFTVYFLLITAFFSVKANNEDFFLLKSKTPHQVQILHHGLAALVKRINLIRHAKESIELEYFIFNRDLAGRILLKELVKRAKEGIEVKILLDYFMTKKSFNKKLIYVLSKNNIQVKFFNSAPIIRFSKSQYRNHRKTFLVDRKYLIIGGRNIGDDYFDLSRKYNFYDRDIYLEGPIVASIGKTFDQFWNSDYSQIKKVKGPEETVYTKSFRKTKSYRNLLKRWNKKLKRYYSLIEYNMYGENELDMIEEVGNRNLSEELSGVCPVLNFISDKPYINKKMRSSNKNIFKYFQKKIKQTRHRLWIDSPYFIINRLIKNTLKNIIVRDHFDFRVYTNGLFSTDAFYANSVLNSSIREYLKGDTLTLHLFSGENVSDYEYLNNISESSRKGTHSKTYIFDQDFFIGTYNFDPRSNIYNMEFGVLCSGNKELTNSIAKNIEHRYQSAHIVKSIKHLSKVKFKNSKIFKIITYYLAKIPAFLFIHLL